MASFSTTTSAQYGNTPAPPPPTPSNQTISNASFHAADADMALSRFLNQLLLNQTAPSLSSPPPRFSKKSPPPPPSPHVISLVDPQPDLLLSAASDFGFFHLTDHGIPSHLPSRAMEEFQSLLSQPEIINNIHSPLGFSHDDDDELVFDTRSTELDAFGAVSEFTKSLGKLGLKVVELILSAALVDSPFKKGTIAPKCLMWVSSSCPPPPRYGAANVNVIKEEEEEEEEEEEGREMKKRRCFPYVVSLQYELKTMTSWVMAESSGLVAVDCSPDSVLVTLGDIAQVSLQDLFET